MEPTYDKVKVPPPKLYLDNCIWCGFVFRDIAEAQLVATDQIVAGSRAGIVSAIVSRQAWVEQDRTQDPTKRAALDARRADIERMADDHVVLGFSTNSDQYGGFCTMPLVTDVVDAALLACLKIKGLKESDARHVMYAVHHRCDWFITTDPDFGIQNPVLRRDLESLCRGLRIASPVEIVAAITMH